MPHSGISAAARGQAIVERASRRERREGVKAYGEGSIGVNASFEFCRVIVPLSVKLAIVVMTKVTLPDLPACWSVSAWRDWVSGCRREESVSCRRWDVGRLSEAVAPRSAAMVGGRKFRPPVPTSSVSFTELGGEG